MWNIALCLGKNSSVEVVAVVVVGIEAAVVEVLGGRSSCSNSCHSCSSRSSGGDGCGSAGGSGRGSCRSRGGRKWWW